MLALPPKENIPQYRKELIRGCDSSVYNTETLRGVALLVGVGKSHGGDL